MTSSIPADLRRRVQDAARAELRRQPVAVPWTRRAWQAVGALFAFSLLALGVAVAVGIGSGARLADKAPVLALLVAAQALGVWAVAAPLSGRRLVAAAAAAGAAGIAIALGRAGAPVQAGAAPDWLCTISHLGVDLIPAIVALALLRGGAWHPLRAAVAGLAAGTAGLLVGEIGCARGLTHVVVYHLGFWLAAAGALLLATRRLRPRTFAP